MQIWMVQFEKKSEDETDILTLMSTLFPRLTKPNGLGA